MRYTSHALDRLSNRLQGLILAYEINKVIYENTWKIPYGRSYLIVKRIAYTEISDPEVKPDGIARGDILVAVIDNKVLDDLQITNIVLRKTSSQSDEYRYINPVK